MTEKNNDEKLRLAEKVELLAPAGEEVEIGRASCRERV